MANLHDPGSWDDEAVLIDHLAHQLVLGRLAIILGAGTSQFYGLPNWQELVNRVCRTCGEPSLGPGDDPIAKVGAIRIRHYKTNPLAFLRTVREALYQGRSVDFEEIRSNSLLSAIGSLIMSSRRGNVASVINFNFDDLLEIYLEFHGFVTYSIFRDRHWAGNRDVTIYHPHGFIPLDPGHPSSDNITLGTDDYLTMMQPDANNLWRPLLQTTLRTHTFLHIGLSGKDPNLQSLIHPLKEQHAIQNERIAFHGVRFVSRSDVDHDTSTLMRNWGVYSYQMDSFSLLPGFLFRLCQSARDIRLQAERV